MVPFLVYVDISVGRVFALGLSTIVNFSRKILSPTYYPVLLAGTARDKNIMALLRDTQRFLHFNLSHTGDGEDNHYVDLAFLLSAANRRTYRQGMVYHIANIVFDDADGDADIDVCTIPNTWNTQAAWELGFTKWHQQQAAAARSLGIDLGTWSDFKINLNADMETDVDQAALIDVNGNTFSYGDWDKSVFEIPQDGATDPTEADIIMMGNRAGTYPNITQVSLLNELEKAMEVPMEDPALPSGASTCIYSVLSPEQSDAEVLAEVVQNIEDHNDLPPYDRYKVMGAGTAGSGRPSSPWVARTCMIKGGGSTSSPVAAVGGFAAPCGLLMIETNAGADNSIGVTIELVPGEYKGVHAYPMRGGGF